LGGGGGGEGRPEEARGEEAEEGESGGEDMMEWGALGRRRERWRGGGGACHDFCVRRGVHAKNWLLAFGAAAGFPRPAGPRLTMSVGSLGRAISVDCTKDRGGVLLL